LQEDVAMPEKRRKRSDRLLGILTEYTKIVVITHDTPDPDAVAAGWGIHALVRERLNRPVRLVGGGAIVRAENVHMVKLLGPPIELVNEYTPEPECAAVLVDCSVEGANHLLGDGTVRPVAVIDHHKSARTTIRIPFRDIRPRAAAAATIAGGYLREQNVEPSKQLATALLYAVRTEALNQRSPFTRTDRGLVSWLSPRADHQALAEIENAPLTRQYFEEMMLAFGSTFLYGDTAVCFLPQAGSADMVGEVADLLIRCTEIHQVLCGAAVDNQLTISVRTSATGGDAVKLLSPTLKGLGHWGGHPNRAGGRIVASGAEGRITQQVLEDVKTRWLRACGVGDVRGTRLVTKRDVLGLF
jgi:nanoRNase/pAp phosphatase (c-di-AMP/oligoRNAs hydrolase)